MANVIFERPGPATSVVKVIFSDGAEVVEISQEMNGMRRRTLIAKTSDGRELTIACDKEKNDGRDSEVW